MPTTLLAGARSPRHSIARTLAATLAIAGVLAGGAHAQAPTPPAEAHLEAMDPALYEAAREFFPSDEYGQSSRRLFRLTRDQIDLTVAYLLPGYAKRSVKTAMAKDPLQTNYEYAELLSFNAANIQGLKGWIGEIAEAVKKDPSKVVDCGAAKNNPDCLKRAAQTFILKAFRGDPIPKETDHAKVVKLADAFVQAAKTAGVPQATADLVEVVLSSPDFLFRKETDSTRRGHRMPPSQLLQTLTYTLADTLPEALGLDSTAALAHLQTPGDREATTEAILTSKESREKLVRFIKAWLELKEPGEFRVSKTVFPEFTDTLAAAMIEETDRFLRAALSKPQPRLTDITLATQSFVSKALEPVHGVKASDPSGAKPVALDRAKRLGIFTHPAILASHSGNTNSAPMKRGTFFSRKVLCLELEPPPPGIDISVYDKPGATERQRIEAVTSQKSCIGCHKMIDPLGFFQHNYDALGRWRDKDEEGFPIDASMKPGFLGKDVPTTTTPVEALKLLTATNNFKQCFVRQAFRFYMGRKEEPSDDRVLRELFMHFTHKDEQDILGLVRRLALSDRILLRQAPGGSGSTQ